MPIRLNRKPKRASAKERRETLRGLLESRDTNALRAWAAADAHAIRTLFAALFELDPRLRWRAIEALGHVAAELATSDPNRIRDWIRRILWNMMEESGGLMWHGPEAIGEVLARVPVLASEYVGPLGSFRMEEPFEAGTYTALARLAEVAPASVRRIAEALVPGLTDPDPRIRAHAALALGRVGHAPAVSAVRALVSDPDPVTVYDAATGELRETTVGALVAEVLLSSRPSRPQ